MSGYRYTENEKIIDELYVHEKAEFRGIHRLLAQNNDRVKRRESVRDGTIQILLNIQTKICNASNTNAASNTSGLGSGQKKALEEMLRKELAEIIKEINYHLK